jgi:transcription elongation factor Elf1
MGRDPVRIPPVGFPGAAGIDTCCLQFKASCATSLGTKVSEVQVEELPVPVACPSCGYRSRVKIRRLRQGQVVDCSSCSLKFTFDGEEIERELAKLERAILAFVRRLSPVSRPT